MRRFRTLQFRLSALVFAFGLLLIAVIFIRQYIRDTGAAREKLRRNAYAEGVRLAGLSQHLLRRHRVQTADLATTYASLDPDLQLGVICDGADLIQHATEKQWSGVPLKESPLAGLDGVLARARATMEACIEETDDGRRLVGVFPFWDVTRNMTKGAVILDYDLERPVLVARNRTLRESAAQACALLGACMILWALLQLMVTERVKKVVEQTQHIGLDMEQAKPLQGHDELALISAAIADSVERLRKTENKLTQIASSMRDVFWVAPPHPDEPPYVNAAYRRLFDRSEKALQRRRWDWLRPVVREDRRKILEMLRTLRKGHGEPEVEVEVRLSHGNQKIRWMRCRGFSTSPPQEETSGDLPLAGVVMDITERKEVERRVLEAAEQERRRIGQDLHDDVCQRLSAAQLKSGVLEAALRRGAVSQAPLAGEVAKELSEATDIARRYASGLAPVGVGAAAMPDAIADLAVFLRRAFGVQCTSKCDDLTGAVQADQAAQIYRIVQELATNAARHSGATGINIALTRSKDWIRLRISDDGSSFDPRKHRKKGGMGMHVLQQRVDALGASLIYSTRSEDGKGTIAVCEIPLGRNTVSSPREAYETVTH